MEVPWRSKGCTSTFEATKCHGRGQKRCLFTHLGGGIVYRDNLGSAVKVVLDVMSIWLGSERLS
jgi:hypothetical protein